jgi:hypothetical protein
VTDALYGHIREEVDDGILHAVDAAMAWMPSDEDEDLAAEVAAELADELDEGA